MNIRVSFYSYLKDLTGCAEYTAAVPEGATLTVLKSSLLTRFPGLHQFEKSMLTAVGVDYQGPGYVLQPGDDVALFPPVQGG